MHRAEPRDATGRTRPFADAFLRALARRVLSVFFRRIEVAGGENFPSEGPVILVANHTNSLVDGIMVTALSPRMPRLVATSTLWAQPLLRPFLALGGVIPILRRIDQPGTPVHNADSFARCRDLMQAGGVLVLFPEGVSHNEPHMMPVRTGAARIALDSGSAVRILPAALVYEAKTRFRSRALLQFGPPVGVSDLAAGYGAGEEETRHALVRELTDRIAGVLHALVPQFATWDDARLNALAADLWIEGENRAGGLEERAKARREFLDGYHWGIRNHPDCMIRVRAALDAYRLLLEATGLTDPQVVARIAPRRRLRLAGPVLLMLLLGPFWAVGIVLNILPYSMARAIGRRYASEQRATWTLFPGLGLFPGFWGLQALVAGGAAALIDSEAPAWAIGLAVLAAGPVCGRIALAFVDTSHRAARAWRGWRRSRANLQGVEDLAASRATACEALHEIAALYRRETGED